MKKVLYIFMLLVLFSMFSFCEVKYDNIEWQYMYGDEKMENTSGMEKTSDGGYIMVGRSNFYQEWTDIYVVKTNGNGELECKLKFGGNDCDEVYDVIEAYDGGYILVGETWSTDIEEIPPLGSYDAIVLKISAEGSVKWIKNYGGSSSENFHSIAKTFDGGYIVCGYTASTNIEGITIKGEFDYYVVKFTSDFQIEWQKNYGGSKDDTCYSIKQTSDGGYIISGKSCSTDIPGVQNHDLYPEDYSINGDIYVVKIDAYGEIEWQKMYGGDYTDRGGNIFQTSDGGYMILGGTDSSKIYDTNLNWSLNLFILKTNNVGEKEWYYLIDTWGSTGASDMIELSDGSYLFAGSTSADVVNGLRPKGDCSIYIFKLDNSGKFIWHTMFGGNGLNSANRIIPTDDGGYVVGGSSDSTNLCNVEGCGYSDFYIFKFFE